MSVVCAKKTDIGKEVVEYLNGLMRRKVITTCTGIGRAFMFLALNEHELHNYLSALVWNKKLTQYELPYQLGDVAPRPCTRRCSSCTRSL